MPDLMPKMSEQRAQRLAHFVANFFAGGVIRFRNVQRDQALLMSGHDPLDAAIGIRLILQESKGQPLFRIIRLIGDGELEIQQGVDQPVLGRFHLVPQT